MILDRIDITFLIAARWVDITPILIKSIPSHYVIPSVIAFSAIIWFSKSFGRYGGATVNDRVVILVVVKMT